jgi:long-chain acyl-CoA synthetase
MALLDASFSTLPEMFDGVFNALKDSKTHFPYARKINGQYQNITYPELQDQVLAIAAFLRSIGIENGDRAAILSENRLEWAISDMGTLKASAIDVPIYPTLPPNQISYILTNSECKAIFVSTELQLRKILKIQDEVPSLKTIISFQPLNEKADNLIEFQTALRQGQEILKEQPGIMDNLLPKPDDVATLIYTSGTTGSPKGVMLTHKNLCENVKSCSDILRLDQTDSCLSFLPLSHAYERTAGYYLMFACGAQIYFAESIETVSLNISESKPTVIITVPRLFERIKNSMLKTVDAGSGIRKKLFYWALDVGYAFNKQQRDGNPGFLTSSQLKLADTLVLSKIKAKFGGRLRFFVSGGAALPRQTGEFFEALGITILEGFGLTETAPVTHVNRPGMVKFGTVGLPVKNVEVKIAEDGEILLKGPNIMKGYWQDEQATNDVIKDNWFYTGDIGEIDEDGCLKITDRKKHIIVSSGGKNITPQPIENLIGNSPYVDQVMVYGEKRPFLVALIVPNFDNLEDFAKAEQISFQSREELIYQEKIQSLYTSLLKETSTQLAAHEKVRKFLTILEPFSVENGSMTPTLKLKRKTIQASYADEINDLYKGMVYEG